MWILSTLCQYPCIKICLSCSHLSKKNSFLRTLQVEVKSWCCQVISWKNQKWFHLNFLGEGERGSRETIIPIPSVFTLFLGFWKISLLTPSPSFLHLVGMFSMIIHLTSLAWIVQKNHPIRCEMRQWCCCMCSFNQNFACCTCVF